MAAKRLLLLWVLAGSIAWGAEKFVGAAACGECHPEQYEKQARSRHAHALRPILETPLPRLLIARPVQEPGGATLEYRIAPKGLRVTARQGSEQASALLEWAFGAGAQGFTPVGRAGNIYFEHRISYYTGPARPALTLGHPAGPPSSATEALGLIQAPETIYRCFNCHATGAQQGKSEPDLSSMRPGVECERCHGPGGAHVAAARAHRPAAEIAKTLLNPGRFPARAVVEICAECHRLAKPRSESPAPEIEDPISVRFAPVGFSASKCFRAGKNFSCLTCHNPHEDAQRDDAFYTATCLRCHSDTSGETAKSQCKRSTRQDCLPCHMRHASPAPYLTFTDHRIRVYPAAAAVADFPAVEKLIASGQYKEALAALEEMPPVSAQWHFLASKALDGLNQPRRAVDEARQAVDMEPGNEAHHLQLAQLLLSHSAPERAYDVLRNAQRLFPDSLLVRLGEGLALKEMERWEEAEKELLACLTTKPDLGVAFDALETIYLNTKRYEDTQRAAETFLKNNPGDFRGYYYLAAARDGLKLETGETEGLLRRAIQIKPEFAASHALLGKILLEGGRAAEAAPVLEQAVRLRPDYAPSHYYLATAYRQLGRKQEAAREFQAVSDLNKKERESVPPLLRNQK
ncbi:MAG TPA: tetratricopeptide repeat protein [Bryobacterales bacterium]|nr:tetratricopeptide repeat protein [Bryobacterales bacterium]